MGAGAPSPPPPKVKALNCPNCGAALTVRTFEQAVTVVCGHCHSILDAKDPSLQILQHFKTKEEVRPLIPLGTRGKLRGTLYEVVGFQRRTIVVEGVHYSWFEYLLFNPYEGYRYLTEYMGHWNDVKVVRSIPQSETSRGRPTATLLGETYRHFQTATAETTYVLGEFPWQVRVGEKANVLDFVSPPRILSAETMEGETTWSVGEYMSGDQVWKAFQLSGKPPSAVGVFENQPSPFKGISKKLWQTCGALLVTVVVMAIIFSVLARNEEVFSQTYTYDPRVKSEASFVTDVFELKGHTSDVEVSIGTNLSNNWAYFNLALINEDTGEAFDFGREVSYYYGRDEDGPWTEGSQEDEAILPAVPSGRYYLRVEPDMTGAIAVPVAYTLHVRRDVPRAGFFFLAGLMLLLPPLVVSWRSLSFEHLRWQESDYAP